MKVRGKENGSGGKQNEQRINRGLQVVGGWGGWAASVHNQHLCNVPDMLHFKLFQTLQRVERYHHVRTLLAEHEHVQSLRWKHNIYRTAKKEKENNTNNNGFQ